MYVAYTTFYILGLLLSMQVPFVGFQPIRTSEHMAAAGKDCQCHRHCQCHHHCQCHFYHNCLCELLLHFSVVSGVFALLQAYAAVKFAQHHLTGKAFKYLFQFAIIVSAALVLVTIVLLTTMGYVAPWSGRFYSLWDTGYALAQYLMMVAQYLMKVVQYLMKVVRYNEGYMCIYIYHDLCVSHAISGMPRSTFP